MIVDETNPVTPEADSAMPETASLARVAIKRRKNAAADGSAAPKKARKETDPNGPGRIKTIKRGRKAALVFDDSMPTAQPIQFDPPVAAANGTASSHASADSDIAVPTENAPPAEIAAAETAAPELNESVAEIARAPLPEPAEAAPDPVEPEMPASIVEFAEIPMPVEIEVEFDPDPEFTAYANEPMPADPAPVTGAADAAPAPADEAEAKPQWQFESDVAAEAPAAVADEEPAMEEVVAPAAPEESSPATPSNETASDEQSTQRSPASRFEAIARAARMSALSSSKPGIAKTIAVDAARSAEVQKRSTEIFGYWVRAKNGRRFPSRSDFEIAKVAEFWPNSMLLTCDGAPPAGSNHRPFSKVMRLDNNSDGSPSEFNFTSMLIEWILTIGGEAARVGQPVQDTEVFPSSDGTHAYKIVALPLSDHQTQVDHVLCHLTRS